MNTRATHTLTLHPNGVVAPALQSMRTAGDIVLATVNVNATADPRPADMMSFDFGAATERAERNTSWLIANAILELARGMRASLEQAHLYLRVFSLIGESVTFGEFHQTKDDAERWANKVNFPDLLAVVEKGLASPLNFSREIISVQKARNCIEHRKGVVTEKDADEGTDALRLTYPRFRMFIGQDGQEIDIYRGMEVEGGTLIRVQTQIRERMFRIGEQIKLTVPEFHELAFGVHFFANDLLQKLPKK